MRITCIQIVSAFFLLVFLSADTIAEEDQKLENNQKNDDFRVQTLVVCNAHGIVSLSILRTNNNKESSSTFELANKGESYSIFVDKSNIWTWNSRVGYRLYKFGNDQTLMVFDPKIQGLKIPEKFLEVSADNQK